MILLTLFSSILWDGIWRKWNRSSKPVQKLWSMKRIKIKRVAAERGMEGKLQVNIDREEATIAALRDERTDRSVWTLGHLAGKYDLMRCHIEEKRLIKWRVSAYLPGDDKNRLLKISFFRTRTKEDQSGLWRSNETRVQISFDESS